ncbi:MAG: hypothetical protein QOE82_3598 [Thermoanaerobaculia bacterium]|jgi:hypothetical protein|nr:hypothetical protein [Thermoanaerobaculia bacterium]
MSNSDEAENQAAFALLQAELTRIRDSTLEAWRGFLTWFTWFFGTQTLVVGWIMTRKEELPSGTNMIALTAATATLNIIGILAALNLRSFAALQMKRADAIGRAIAERAEASGLSIDITSGFPGDFIRLASAMGAGALITAVVLWSYLFCRAILNFA